MLNDNARNVEVIWQGYNREVIENTVDMFVLKTKCNLCGGTRESTRPGKQK